jgi:peptide/nickel transport system substrate-binding protein
MKRTLSILAIGCFISVFFFGTGQASEAILKTRILGNIRTLDAGKVNQVNDHAVVDNISSHLVRYKPGTVTIEPDLATSWKVSPDGREFTFYLRKGVKWHKGFGEFTAKDVKYTIERAQDPKTKSPYSDDFSTVGKVEVVDDYTVRLILKEPSAPLLTVTLPYRAGWIVNQKAVEKYGTEYGLNPIGTGPFMFEKYVPGTEVVLTANKDYYEGPPRLDKLVFKPISEETAAEIALEKGDIDIMYFRSPEVYGRLKANKGIVVEEKAGPGMYFLVFNIDRKPFNDVRVRRAIHYAINKDQIANVILGGVAVKAVNMIPPMAFAYTEDVMRYDYSPEQARKLLQEAGLGNGFKTTLHYSQLSPWPAVVPVIQEDLRKVNIEAELKGAEHATHLLNIPARKNDFFVNPLLRPPDPDEVFSNVLHSKGPVNGSAYRAMDKEIERAKAEMSPEKRKAMYVQLQKKVMEDCPTIPLFHLKVVVARKPYVKGHPVDFLNGFSGYSTYIEK